MELHPWNCIREVASVKLHPRRSSLNQSTGCKALFISWARSYRPCRSKCRASPPAFPRPARFKHWRVGNKVIGFNKNPAENDEQERGKLLSQVAPEDLLEYGLIPELIGRLPVLGALGPLSEDEMVRILLEPKNALIKQYIIT